MPDPDIGGNTMDRSVYHVHKWGESLFLNDPNQPEPKPDNGSDQGDGGEAGGGEPLSREVRGFIGDTVKRAIAGAGFVTQDAFNSSLDSFSEKITGSITSILGQKIPGGGDSDGDKEPKDPEKPSDPATDDDASQSVEVRRMRADIKKEREAREKLEQKLQEQTTQAGLEKRDNSIRAAARDAGARDPDEILDLTKKHLVEDATKGWLYEVDGEYGKEFLSFADYIQKYLAEKSYLKKPLVKEGSGAGGGSEGSVPGDTSGDIVDGRQVNAKNLEDAVWYRKNRLAIQAVLAKRMAKHQSANPS